MIDGECPRCVSGHAQDEQGGARRGRCSETLPCGVMCLVSLYCRCGRTVLKAHKQHLSKCKGRVEAQPIVLTEEEAKAQV